MQRATEIVTQKQPGDNYPPPETGTTVAFIHQSPLGVSDTFQNALTRLWLAQNTQLPLCKLKFVSEIGALFPLLNIQICFQSLFHFADGASFSVPSPGWCRGIALWHHRQQKALRWTHTSPTTTALSFLPHPLRQIWGARTTYHECTNILSSLRDPQQGFLFNLGLRRYAETKEKNSFCLTVGIALPLYSQNIGQLVLAYSENVADAVLNHKTMGAC